MYKKYRITLTILGLIASVDLLFLFTKGSYYIGPVANLFTFEGQVGVILLLSLPLFIISLITLIISDIIYLLRKLKLPIYLRTLDILIIIVIIYTYFNMINIQEISLLLIINIIIWLLQIIFTFRWNKNLKK